MVVKNRELKVNTKLDEKKILLVVIGKDTEEIKQCLKLMQSTQLSIMNDFEIEIHSIIMSENIAVAFNEVQKKYNAKYKIYVNASLRFISKSIVVDTYNAFFIMPKVGMIGLLGSEMPLNGDYTKAENFYGKYIYVDENGEAQEYSGKTPLYIQSVGMLEFNFFATNVDISWDEKIDNEFLMAAQCCKYQSNNYLTCAVFQSKTWLIFSEDNCSYNFKTNQLDYQNKLEKFRNLYINCVTPLVSVLIPAYNQPKFLVEALESALNQTYPNIEILVGDDSTNKEVKNAIQPYLKKYNNIKYFYHGKPLGGRGGNNMSFLLNRCSGKYVNFLLHDDLFYPEKISKMMDYYVKDLEQRISVVTCARDRLEESTGRVTKFNPWQPQTDTILSGRNVGLMSLFILANFLGELTTCLVRKNDLMVKGFADSRIFQIGIFCGMFGTSYGDLDTWLNILRKGGDCVFIAESLTAFRSHAEQNTNKADVRIGLPLDMMNFITVAWLCNIFFEDDEDYKFAYRKWPIFLSFWYTEFEEDDTPQLKKMKEWANKLRDVIKTDNHKKVVDCAISHLLSFSANSKTFYKFVKKNETTGLWEKDKVRLLDGKFLDSCNNIWVVYGKPALTVKKAKFGKTLKFDGTGCIEMERPVTLGGNIPFTVECFAYGVARPDLRPSIWTLYLTPDDRLRIAVNSNGNLFVVFISRGVSFAVWDTEINITSKIHHFEVGYDGENFYCFCDGILLKSFNKILPVDMYKLKIGSLFSVAGHLFVGTIEEFRMSVGICRHTADFKTPTKPYEADKYTISLVHFD